MRYRLRTLLILLAVLPPMLWGAFVVWTSYIESRERRLDSNGFAGSRLTRLRIVPVQPPLPKPQNAFPPELDYQYPPESHRQMLESIEPPALSPQRSPPP